MKKLLAGTALTLALVAGVDAGAYKGTGWFGAASMGPTFRTAKMSFQVPGEDAYSKSVSKVGFSAMLHAGYSKLVSEKFSLGAALNLGYNNPNVQLKNTANDKLEIKGGLRWGGTLFAGVNATSMLTPYFGVNLMFNSLEAKFSGTGVKNDSKKDSFNRFSYGPMVGLAMHFHQKVSGFVQASYEFTGDLSGKRDPETGTNQYSYKTKPKDLRLMFGVGYNF